MQPTIIWNNYPLEAAVAGANDTACKVVAEKIAASAKNYCPKGTGALANSIEVKKIGGKRGGYRINAYGDKSAGRYYACILGASTYIKMKDGYKHIGEIKVGDYVIAQDGLPHRINYVNRFPASEKPDLIKLTVEYRKDRVHKLIVTEDHKILIYKNGVSHWEYARNLLGGDLLFSPIKKDYKKGISPEKVCINCHKIYQNYGRDGRGKKYCSPKCYHDYLANGHNHHIGKKRSIETKKRMSEQKKQFLKDNPDKHINRILAKNGYETSIEKDVEEWIKGLDISYKKQFNIGRHYIDFMIPKLRLLIEADGSYWHSDQEKDIERDKEIMEMSSDFSMIHIHFADKRFTKVLDPNPIEDVYYLQCNNSMNSFVNLDYYKPVKILDIEHYIYQKTCSAEHYLYDLSVEGIHSFIASGIIVSNSFVELGSMHNPTPQPFLRPAANKHRPELPIEYDRAFAKYER